jgi:hypothetical protein
MTPLGGPVRGTPSKLRGFRRADVAQVLGLGWRGQLLPGGGSRGRLPYPRSRPETQRSLQSVRRNKKRIEGLLDQINLVEICSLLHKRLDAIIMTPTRCIHERRERGLEKVRTSNRELPGRTSSQISISALASRRMRRQSK